MVNSYRAFWGRAGSGLIAGLAAAILPGCAVGPDYVRPEVPVSSNWHSEIKNGLIAGETSAATLASWWTTLNDPALTRLIERALKGNLDLKKALAQVREARAKRGEAEAGLFPTLNAEGSANWSRSDELDSGSATTEHLYRAGFDAGWEIDVFGGARRAVEAAEGDLGASEENLRDALVSLLSEVALNYVDLRTYQTRLTVAEANLKAQEDAHQLAVWRNQAGLSDELAVQQARYNLESTRSQMPTLRAGIEAAMNRIAVLLGEQPGAVHAELQARESIPAASLAVAVGIPADALRRRPDIRRAERQLMAQTARVGVATADLYPKFFLNGSIGLETLSLSDPSSSGALSLGGGPLISWPVFKAGAIRQNIEAQSALQEQYLVSYEAAVLEALEEVENALTAFREAQERKQSLRQATAAAQGAAKLARHKYEAGLTDFDAVLEAQRSLLSFQESLAQSEGTIVSNLIRLYKALGGGWAPINSNDKSDEPSNPGEER